MNKVVQPARSAYESLVKKAHETCKVLIDDSAYTVMVGMATCGISAGAKLVAQSFREALSHSDIKGQVVEVGCLGHCYAEPMAVLKRPGYPLMAYHHLTPLIARHLVEKFFLEEDPLFEFFLGALDSNEMMLPTLMDLPRYGLEQRRLLRRCGLHDPSSIQQAMALGAYKGLARAIEMGSEEVLGALRESGLRGMGGAGFPLWRKWDICRRQLDKERYFICNADEGDPGAFMDRTLMESDPHAILEGIIIGGLTTGAQQGYVYVRSEYPLAVQQMKIAIARAYELHLLGENILGSGFYFDVEVFQGAGAFICGEETALIASIEGKRGIPMVRPPYPVEKGLYGKPTIVNNVKSLASIGPILSGDAEPHYQGGSLNSKGTALFALAGNIVNPGLVEVPLGTTLRQIIFDIGGGIPGGKAFKAVQIGGPSGGCLPAALLDTPVDFDDLKEAGAMMGSGGMVVLDEDTCMVDTARYFLQFTQNESCGKCTFCRIGTKHMLDLLTAITEGRGQPEDLDKLLTLAEEIRDGSLCNLGKTAPNPVLTTLRFFREEYEAHIYQRQCPARVCNAMTTYYILPDKCARGCDACVGSCPTEAIYTLPKRRIKVIDQALCVKCDSCMSACPEEYDAIIKISPLKDVPPSDPRPMAPSEKELPFLESRSSQPEATGPIQ